MAVKIYSTPSCGYCNKAKAYFKANKIPFTDYNVASDQRKAEEMVRKSGQRGKPCSIAGIFPGLLFFQAGGEQLFIKLMVESGHTLHQ